MLLAMDVGNTNITVGLFRESELVSHGRISTREPRTVDEYTLLLKGLLDHHEVSLNTIEGVIISSVVPRATVALKTALKSLVKAKPWVVGETVKAPIINRYRIPGQVGQDRLVNGVAAYTLYGGPVVVVDFGTAVTIDLVSKRREYMGGLIVPGVEIALEALSSRAALLPRIELTPPTEFIGRDTVSSISSGIFFGYSALCDGIVKRLKLKYAPKIKVAPQSGTFLDKNVKVAPHSGTFLDKNVKVVATGGYAGLIAPYCRTIQIVNPHLTLQGLDLIYRKATLTHRKKVLDKLVKRRII